jgi:tetratricopeptide (TPR) repeat protein
MMDIYSSQPDVVEPEELLTEKGRRQEHLAGFSGVSIFDKKYVDVVGSPRLTTLIGALTIEECRDIPVLDLNHGANQFGLSFDQMDLCGLGSNGQFLNVRPGTDSTLDLMQQLLLKTERCWLDSDQPSQISGPCSPPCIDFGLSPFSQQSTTKRQIFTTSLSCGSPILSEAECKGLLGTTTAAKNSSLVESMWCIAHNYSNMRQYREAESWYRQIVTVKRQNLESQPCETLAACLWVIRSVSAQGKCLEALHLHERLHTKIICLFDPAHGVCLLSRLTQSLVLSGLGRHKKCHEIRRELLQICLATLGIRHPQTFAALRSLGYILRVEKRYVESEQLLRTTLHIQLQEAGICEGDAVTTESIRATMISLAGTLNSVGRYQESRPLLSSANVLAGGMISAERPDSFSYCCEIARTWTLEGRWKDSEKMLQDLLKNQGNTMRPGQRYRVMIQLAETLMLIGRPQEAAPWYEEKFTEDPVVKSPRTIAHSVRLQGCVLVSYRLQAPTDWQGNQPIKM